MLVPAVEFRDVVLAVHILAVVIAFGVMFAYPIIGAVVSRSDPRSTPLLHRIQHTIGTRLIQPGLLVVVIAGVYLAADEHQFSAFYVQWGIGVAVVLGAVGGAFMGPQEQKLIAFSERDVNASGGGEVSFGEDYLALNKRVAAVGAILSLLVVVTVVLMAFHTGSS